MARRSFFVLEPGLLNSWTITFLHFLSPEQTIHSYTLCLDRGGNASVTYSGNGKLDAIKDAGHHQAHAHTRWGVSQPYGKLKGHQKQPQEYDESRKTHTLTFCTIMGHQNFILYTPLPAAYVYCVVCCGWFSHDAPRFNLGKKKTTDSVITWSTSTLSLWKCLNIV